MVKFLSRFEKSRNSAKFQSGTAPAMHCASAGKLSRRPRGIEMTTISNFAQQTFAAVAAFGISVLLFANTLATQAAEVQSVAGILA